MNIWRRRCIIKSEPMSALPSEFRLQAFRQYTRASCTLECRANHLQNKCHCLPYFYPTFGAVWNQSTHCNMTGLQCLAKQSGN